MKGKTKSKIVRIKFAELEKGLDSIDSELEKLKLTKAPKERAIQDSRLIREEIKQLGKPSFEKFERLLNQAYEYLKSGDVRKASEIYLELRKMYIELGNSMKKK